jgi:hypothetical protein
VELPGLVRIWFIVAPDPALAPEILPVIVPTVQVNELGVFAVNAIFGLVPLQVCVEIAVVTTGTGFTVTVIVNGVPAHAPVRDVGVTRYCTDPATALTGIDNVWLIEEPDPALAPVTPPVMVPIVQVKLLGALAVKIIFGSVPLQVAAVEAFVTWGTGLTVTVMVKGAPEQDPNDETGVTIYCTVPAVAWLGLVNIWLIVELDPALAPVMAPVIVPMVQLKLLATLAVRAMFGLVPLHVDAVGALPTTGIGFTVTVIV